MKTPSSVLPGLRKLTRVLSEALGANHRRPIKVLERKLPRTFYSFPNEIVTCLLPDGQKQRVFIKYEAGHSHKAFGHRGDLSYETRVYEHLSRTVPGFRPRYLGARRKKGDTWLMLEYIYGCKRVFDLSFHESNQQQLALIQAASWIGGFHAAQETQVSGPALAFVTRYDAGYYRGWAERTFDFGRGLRRRFGWLASLEACGDAWFMPLLEMAPTVIHGEFYAKNVLARRGQLFVVDWESAAVAPGEIDLAALTEGKHWQTELARECHRQYLRARWPDGAPADFRRRLDAARIYLHFRWLGDRPDWTTRENTLWRYDHLRLTAKRLGLV